MLDEVISRRFNAGLATLFATNYFLDERESPVRETPGMREHPVPGLRPRGESR